MLQGTINGKSAITSKCFSNSAVYSEGVIGTHMSLNLFKTGEQTLQKSIIILPGYEYTINFYDSEASNRKTLTGLVMEVFGDDHTNQYILFKYKELNTNKKQELVGTCGCVINNPSGSYDDYPVKSIPIQNIFDIQYGPDSPLQQPCGCEDTDESCCKGGWTTVLLGIDAEIVKAVTINVKLLDDQCDNAVKLLEMKKNGIYEIAYCKPGTSTVYEITGRLAKIEPLENKTVGTDTGIVHCNCCEKDENVGVAGSIYTSSGCSSDLDSFLSDVGPWIDVKLMFDTSSLADGEYECIHLSWIRGISDVTPEVNPDPVPDGTEGSTSNGMNCNCCANNVLSKGVVYYTDAEGKSLKYYPLTNTFVMVTVDGTEVPIDFPADQLDQILNPKTDPEVPEITEPEKPTYPIDPPEPEGPSI